MPHINAAGLAIIKDSESFRARPYLCPAGIPTVGYGHVIRPGEDFGQPMTEAQGLDLLACDCAAAERAVSRLAPEVSDDDNRFSALVSFVFNLGAGRFQHSTLRMKARRGEPVYDEFLKYTMAAGRRLPGLVIRRTREANLYEHGIS